jgi:hypothetical protein
MTADANKDIVRAQQSRTNGGTVPMVDQAQSPAVLGEATLQEFRSSLGGTLIARGDPEYEATRRVWNGMIDKHPALIVRCSGVSDVITAVQFARSHHLPLAVRGGGHNVAGNAVCDDGLVAATNTMQRRSSNEQRIDVEHLQSGERTRVDSFGAAFTWIDSHCGQTVERASVVDPADDRIEEVMRSVDAAAGQDRDSETERACKRACGYLTRAE